MVEESGTLESQLEATKVSAPSAHPCQQASLAAGQGRGGLLGCPLSPLP